VSQPVMGPSRLQAVPSALTDQATAIGVANARFWADTDGPAMLQAERATHDRRRAFWRCLVAPITARSARESSSDGLSLVLALSRRLHITHALPELLPSSAAAEYSADLAQCRHQSLTKLVSTQGYNVQSGDGVNEVKANACMVILGWQQASPSVSG
jgi:hypothetical protein